MSDTQVHLDFDGPIARATLHTPEGLNVLSGVVLDRIAEMAAKVRRVGSVRFLILGAKGKVFVAGANIKELAGLDSAQAAALAHRGNKAFDAIADLDCITIARLHGAALGGGLELALACDFRVALSAAKIGLPEASLGLVPGWKGISRVTRLAGESAAKRLVFGAELIDAELAKQMGVVDETAPDEAGLDAKIEAMIKKMRRGSPNAVAMTKAALRTGDEIKAFADCFAHGDAREGMTAFIEKRSAAWMEG